MMIHNFVKQGDGSILCSWNGCTPGAMPGCRNPTAAAAGQLTLPTATAGASGLKLNRRRKHVKLSNPGVLVLCCHPKYGKWHVAVIVLLLFAACITSYVGAFFWHPGNTLLTATAHTIISTTVVSLLTTLPNRSISNKHVRIQWRVRAGGMFILCAVVLLSVGISLIARYQLRFFCDCVAVLGRATQDLHGG